MLHTLRGHDCDAVCKARLEHRIRHLLEEVGVLGDMVGQDDCRQAMHKTSQRNHLAIQLEERWGVVRRGTK